MFKIVLVLLISVAGTSAFAGDAGCGLGSMIFKSNKKLLQLFAVTTNASTYSQTFGITSGTSGCSASGFVQNDREIQYFVEVNQEELTREIAQGNGEKLNTLASLHGCSTDTSVKLFSESAQSNFPVLVPSANTTATELITNIKNSSVSKTCTGV